MFVYVTGIAISPSFTWGFQWLLFVRQGTLPLTSLGRRLVSLRLSMLQTQVTYRSMSPLNPFSLGVFQWLPFLWQGFTHRPGKVGAW